MFNLLVGRAGSAIRQKLATPWRLVRRWREIAPRRLLIAPQDIRTGDPTTAADIGAGYFAFAGRIVDTRGASPFALEPISEAWARELNGFGWLRHLRAADDQRLKSRAGVLVDQFLHASARPSPGVAWETHVTARRMIAWMSQSPIILAGGDHAFYGRFIAALTTMRQHLERRITEDQSGAHCLLACIALAEFGLCGEELGAFQRESTAALATEITARILIDGGHVGRNPQALIDLLLDLLPLRQAYAARGIQVPPPILHAIDRMMPMLRLFRHGDGTLALFNGMGLTAPERVATILAYDDARARAMINAPQSGYQRMEAGDCIVIVEAGAVPPRLFSTQAHAGCLSFEFSSGTQRLVVNCGAPDVSRANGREAARTTAAHSTLVLNNTSSCRFATQAGLGKWLGDQILAGPADVVVERDDGDQASTLRLSHDGYAGRFGLIHARNLTLDNDGSRLEGRDVLEDIGKRKPADLPFVLRFHLHPAVAPRLVGDEQTAVLLECPDGDRWLFQADAQVTIEPSVLFAASGGPRATTQLHIAGSSAGQRTIHWVFRRRPITLSRPDAGPTE